jgi:hypothetical protein
MQNLPDLSQLSQLSHAQKDELILALWAMVQALRADMAAQLAAQQVQINELQVRLKLNSAYSGERDP